MCSLQAGAEFLGLITVQNSLRAEAPHVVSELQAAGLRTVIVTGDSARSAVHAAQHCGITPFHMPLVQVRSEGDWGAWPRFNSLLSAGVSSDMAQHIT